MKKIIIALSIAFAFVAVAPTPSAYACVSVDCAPPVVAQTCMPTSFTADDYYISSGERAVLRWDSVGCVYARIDPADFPDQRPPAGSVATLPLYKTTYFTLTVYKDIAQTIIGGQRSLTIYVDSDNGGGGSDRCSINDFYAEDPSIDEGDSTDLNWRTTGCDYVDIRSNDENFNNRNEDGSVSVSPDRDTTYTLYAYPNGGSRTVRINVDTDNGNTCSIDDFYASPTTIARGNTSTLRWNTSGDIDYVTISGFSGQYGSDDSRSVSPYQTTTYTLRAYCGNGNSQTDSVTVRVQATSDSTAPQALTTVATPIGTQARLNGIAIPNTDRASTAWFEWGTLGIFSSRTPAQSVPSGSTSHPYSDVVSGIVPGVTYSYRAVVQNEYGTAYGAPVTFRTASSPTPSPQPVVRSTVRNVVVAQSAPSLLELRVESNYDRMCVNGLIEYTVTYRNISSQTLENTVLQFTNPPEITYLTASRGNYDVTTRTMTISLGSVAAGEQGIVTIRARVNDAAVQGKLSVATASVVYTNTKTRAQEDATAYSLITVSNDCPSGFGASTFGFGSFLPNTLLGWLLLILVILALIVLARQFQKKPGA